MSNNFLEYMRFKNREQEKINERIDEVHEKVNTKMGRQEFSGWLVAVSALVVLVNNVM